MVSNCARYDEDLATVAELMSTRWYGPGQMLYQEGEPADAFYIVAEGSAEEIEPAKDSWGAAARPRVLRRAVVGEAVGANALYAHLTETTADDLYPSSVRADGACTALCLTRDRRGASISRRHDEAVTRLHFKPVHDRYLK